MSIKDILTNKKAIIPAIISLVVLIAVIATAVVIYCDHKYNPEKYLLRKAYKTFESVTKELVNDKALYPIDFSSIEAVNYNGSKYEGKTKLCDLMAEKLGSKCKKSYFEDKDGMFWVVQYSTFNEADAYNHKDGNATVFVDVNGLKNGVNCFDEYDEDCPSPDRFIFHVNKKAKTEVAGIIGPQYVYGRKKK